MSLTDADRRSLLGMARGAVAEGCGVRAAAPDAGSPALAERGACFVTLRDGNGALLGCIGSLAPTASLAEDVIANARRAAFADPRLPAVRAEQLAELVVSISVLGPLEPLDVSSFEELAHAVRPGRDGLVVTAGRHRATFLPKVWEVLPTAEEFLDALWHKAGLGRRTWPATLQVERYGAEEFSDSPAG